MPLSPPRSRRHSRPHPVLNALGTLLLMAGFIALFMPSLVLQVLPAGLAELLVAQAKVLIGVGIGCQVLAVITRAKKARVEADRVTALQQAHPDAPQNGDTPTNIDWTPLKGGGANFRTHHLVVANPHRLEVRTSVQMILFCGLFIALGAGVGGVFIVSGLRSGDLVQALMPGLVGLVFVLTGALLLRSASKRRVFDRTLGGYWRGSGKLSNPQALAAQAEWAWLQDIKALQLLQERITSRSSSGGSRSYWSYELNLVLSDGRRLNVMDHGNYNRLRQDADAIAQFLGVAVLERG